MNKDEVKDNPDTKSGKLSAAELARIALEELNEKPEQIEHDLNKLRQMLTNIPDLKVPMDDEFLLRFLRARKFNCERTLQLIQHYYSMKTEYPELYEKMYPSAVLPAFENNCQLLLPDFDQKGRIVFICQIGNWDPSRCSMDDIFLANQLCMELAVKDEQTQVVGMVNIIDMKKYSLYHLRHFRPSHFKKILRLAQDSFPLRMKQIHLVNESYIFGLLFMMAKPFLSEKIKSRLFLHGNNYQTLHEHVTPAILPEELGGQMGKIDNSLLVKELLDRDKDFQNALKFGYMTQQTNTEKKVSTQKHYVCKEIRKTEFAPRASMKN